MCKMQAKKWGRGSIKLSQRNNLSVVVESSICGQKKDTSQSEFRARGVKSLIKESGQDGQWVEESEAGFERRCLGPMLLSPYELMSIQWSFHMFLLSMWLQRCLKEQNASESRFPGPGRSSCFMVWEPQGSSQRKWKLILWHVFFAARIFWA